MYMNNAHVHALTAWEVIGTPIFGHNSKLELLLDVEN